MEITEYLPVDFRTQMEAETLCGAEEIRLRVGQPLEILYADEKEKEIGLLTEAHMREVLNYLSGYSVYALEEELRQGYFTLEGGHRIGVSGRASYEKHGTSSCMKLLSCISGLNIRRLHEKKGLSIGTDSMAVLRRECISYVFLCTAGGRKNNLFKGLYPAAFERKSPACREKGRGSR